MPEKEDGGKAIKILKLPNIKVVILGLGLFFLFLLVIRLLLPGKGRDSAGDKEASVSSGKPTKLFVANVTGQQATLFFVTEKKGHASVYVGAQHYTDDRGENTQDTIHQVTLSNLSPDDEYLAKICTNNSCDKNSSDWYGVTVGNEKMFNPLVLEANQIMQKGLAIRIRTGADLEIESVPVNLISGKVKGLDRLGILTLEVTDTENTKVSSQLATLVLPEEGWLMDLANTRKVDLSAFYSVDESDIINIRLYSGDGDEIFQEDVKLGELDGGQMDINLQ